MKNKYMLLRTGSFCLAAVLGASFFAGPVEVKAAVGSGIVQLNNEILKIPKPETKTLKIESKQEQSEFVNDKQLSSISFDSDVANDITSMNFTADKSGEWSIYCVSGEADLSIKTTDGTIVLPREKIAKKGSTSVELTEGTEYVISVQQVVKDISALLIDPKDPIDISSYNRIKDQTEFKSVTNTYEYVASETGDHAFVLDELTSEATTVSINITDKDGNKVKTNTGLKVNGVLTAPLTKGEKYTVTIKGLASAKFAMSIYVPKAPVDITEYTEIEDFIAYSGNTCEYSYTAPRDGAYHFALESKDQQAPVRVLIKDKNGKLVDDIDFVTKKVGAKSELIGGETYSVTVKTSTNATTKTPAFKLYVTPQKETKDVTEFDKIEDSLTFKYQRNNYTLNVTEKGEYTFNFDLSGSNDSFVYFIITDKDGNKLLDKEYHKKDAPMLKKTLEVGTYTLTVRGEDSYSYAMTIEKPSKSTDANSQILDFVKRIYIYVLDREPEEAGSKYWSDELFNFRRTGAEVAQGFIFSPEFEARGTTDQQFVTILYKTFFGREPEADGMNYWLSQLSSGAMDRTAVANGFIFSQEWADTCASYGIRSGGDITPKGTIKPTEATYAFVERMYTTCMGRGYDADGREYWAAELANFNITGEQLGASFFLSDEMAGYNLSDEEFVNRLYLTFMDRESDADGASYWLGLMASGTPRSDVVFGFTRSPEFNEKCVAARILPF